MTCIKCYRIWNIYKIIKEHILETSKNRYHNIQQKILKFNPQKTLHRFQRPILSSLCRKMQTYNELLSQFHQTQEPIVEEDFHVHYIQLLNQVKLNKEKKFHQRNKFNFQSERLKTYNKDSMKQSFLQRSLQLSKITQSFDPYKQKRSLIELEGESLLKEINNIQSGFEKLRVEKRLLQEQLQIINKKQLQISFALCESQNNLEELRALIKDQKSTNDREFATYDKKISELTDKLASINEQNMLKAKHYKHLSTAKVQTKNKTLLGSILMWQKEQSKLKKIPKKLYSKTQIQSMLRALFLITKFSELNYGNIIEHLSKVIDPANPQNIKPKTQNKLFLNDKGQEITIYELISKLQSQLLTPNQCKFLSKSKIVDFYSTKGIVIQSDWEPSNLIPETIAMIKKVVSHFQNLTSWFSRIQKRNLQLSENFRSLLNIQEQLEYQIKSIQNSAVQNSINYLQSRQQQIQQLHQKLNGSCKVIFLFNINIHDLIRRFQNLNKFFDKIVKSTHRRTNRKTFYQIHSDTEFLKKINKSLFKSPQCIIMDWNNVIKRIKTESNLAITSQMFQQLPENEMYFETIMRNDLLRIYAEPSMFDGQKCYIENLQNTFDYVFGEEQLIIEKLCLILKSLLMFSKKGLIECKKYINAKKQENKKKLQKKEESQIPSSIDPLIKLLQQSNVKLDKFFVKDEVKEQTQKPPETDMFCVQSNEFYRRDNFKLIEKLEKLDLKRRGLLPSVPFAVNTSLQLQPFTRTVEQVSLQKDNSRFCSTRNSYRRREPRLSHQMYSARHNVVSERRQFENTRKKDLKNLLSNIASIASENQKYRIRKKINCQEEGFSASSSRIVRNQSHVELKGEKVK